MADDQDIDAILQEARSISADVETSIEERKSKDRSFIARTAIFTFFGVFGCIFALIVVSMAQGVDWQAPASFLADQAQKLLLPIVTLILGYYFGTAKS